MPVIESRTGRQVEDQLRELMEEHERPLYCYVLSFVRDHDLASDCVQDTLLRAYEALRAGKSINRPWLYTVARNRAMDELRQRQRLRTGSEAEERMVEEGVDERLIVRQLTDHLPPVDREVLYLFAVVGFKTNEIAGMLGTSGAAIRQRLYRARNQFRMLYAAEA
jgi:RNA polymerase sigma-70 factor (ECF subfamily)